jgi:L-asparaginase
VTTTGHVALLATGGTIAQGPDGRLGAKALIRMAAAGTLGLPDTHVLGIDVADRHSSRADAPAVEALADAARAALNHRDCLGVVITHGTDTLEEAAFALDLLADDPRPIVVTGAMIPPRKTGTDAPGNIAEAVAVALSPAARARGVLVALHHRIHAPAEVRKRATVGKDAFDSGARGPVGWIGPGVVEFVRPSPRTGLHSPRLEPGVELVRLCLGSGAGAIARASEAHGLVVETFGLGNAPPEVCRAIAAATAAGRTVLVTSRVGDGPLEPEAPLLEAGAVPAILSDGLALGGLKARVLLMAALGAGLDRHAITAILGRTST